MAYLCLRAWLQGFHGCFNVVLNLHKSHTFYVSAFDHQPRSVTWCQGAFHWSPAGNWMEVNFRPGLWIPERMGVSNNNNNKRFPFSDRSRLLVGFAQAVPFCVVIPELFGNAWRVDWAGQQSLGKPCCKEKRARGGTWNYAGNVYFSPGPKLACSPKLLKRKVWVM